MSRALNKLSDTQLRKINGTPAQKTTFLNDGGNLSIRHSTSGLLTWYFTYRALMAGGVRYDLKGQPCGEVTPQEQQEAETRLVALNEKRKRQRRAAKEKTGA
ncbi:hypothetical protein C1590_002091 [Escherichia coli]|nr:hypothetical protein [Escherichia coli]